MVAPFKTSTSVWGRPRLVWFVMLNDSQRNCTASVSPSRKRLDKDVLSAKVPGPSRMFRPELPYRKAPTGNTGNAVRSNHWSGEGFGSVPLAMRLGRPAPPVVISKFATFGVYGGPV